MTAVDRPDNGQDEGRGVAELADYWTGLSDAAFVVSRVADRDYGRGHSRGMSAAYLRAVDDLTAALASGRARAGEQQREIVLDALRLIAGAAPHCENYRAAPFCRDPQSGRVRGAQYGADRWCDPCVAADALALLGGTQPGGEAGR